MTGPLAPIRMYLAANDTVRGNLVRLYRERFSAQLVWDAVEALADAGLDVSVEHAVPEAVVVAEIALRHRDLVGRVHGFGPDDYAEMMGAVRSVLGEFHPDDAADLAAHDLWETQDRWTGEPAAQQPQHARPTRAVALLRASAAAAL